MKVVSLEGMGKATGGALLLRRERAGGSNYRKEIVGTSDGRVRLQPVVAAEGAASWVKGSLHHLLHESWIGRIDAKRLSAPDRRIERPVGHILHG